jgi:hypothetical protein
MYKIDDLLRLAEAYASVRGVSLYTLSRRIFGPQNSATLPRLAKGHGCNVATAAQASRWFDENWPADLPWPLDKAAE